jgi:hypothetical protein
MPLLTIADAAYLEIQRTVRASSIVTTSTRIWWFFRPRRIERRTLQRSSSGASLVLKGAPNLQNCPHCETDYNQPMPRRPIS